jgi:hypothetical protein
MKWFVGHDLFDIRFQLHRLHIIFKTILMIKFILETFHSIYDDTLSIINNVCFTYTDTYTQMKVYQKTCN